MVDKNSLCHLYDGGYVVLIVLNACGWSKNGVMISLTARLVAQFG